MKSSLQALLSSPIIQAPMAGASNSATVVTACQAGALGSLGTGMMTPQQIHQSIDDIKSATDLPFCVNLMVLPQAITERYNEPMPKWLGEYYDKLGIVPVLDDKPAQSFDAQFQVLLDNPVPVASFTFGIISIEQVQALKQVGTLVIGTANCPDEVIAWADVGADAVVVQGAEAGGHRGGWLDESASPMALAQLFTAVTDRLSAEQVKIALIAAGGIHDGGRVRYYLNHGAVAVAVGTAFLSTAESCISPLWKSRLLAGGETRLTRLYSGKLARGLVTGYMQDFVHLDGLVRHPHIPIYPTMNAMTKSLRAHGASTQDDNLMSLWAGAGVSQCRDESMADLVARLVADVVHGER